MEAMPKPKAADPPSTATYKREMVPVATANGTGDVGVHRWHSQTEIAAKLVFLHANGFNALTYRKILEQIGLHHSVIAIDLRGHGHTTLPADPHKLVNWKQHSDDVIATLDALGETGPLVLGGHSMGAATCLLATLKRPDLVSRIIAFEPVFVPLGLNGMLRTFRRIMPGLDMPMAVSAKRRRSSFESREAIFESYKGRGAFKYWPDDMLEDYIEGGTAEKQDGTVELSCHPTWEAANYRTAGISVWLTFARIKCPIRILHATYRTTTPKWVVDRLVKNYGDIESRYFEDNGHMLPMERHETAIEEILAWMEA